MKKNNYFKVISMIYKYCFAIFMLVMGFLSVKSQVVFLGGLLELLFIFLISDLLFNIHKTTGRVINVVLLLIFNIQSTVYYFGSSFITTFMLSNLASLHDLKSKFVIYGIFIVLLILSAATPMYGIPFSRKKSIRIVISSLFAVLATALYICFNVMISSAGSHFVNTAKLIYEECSLYVQNKKVQSVSAGLFTSEVDPQANSSGRELLQSMGILPEDSESSDDISSPDSDKKTAALEERKQKLSDKPNVILIFSEGTSRHIIDDERGIMPEVADYMSRSICFDNYFNSSFATYHALISQFYSGYQMNNEDYNYLISLPMIMSENGYRSVMVNTEPDNKMFTDYLNSMGFDRISSAGENQIFDKRAYELLFDEVCKLNEEDTEEPYFLSIYTFGTHVNLTNADVIFEPDPTNLLNRFRNSSAWFGNFMEKLEENGYLEDTIVIYTSDHSIYKDNDFWDNFPDYEVSFEACGSCDNIPLFIYYDGVEHSVIDANGKNSIDIAPTILDFIGISGDNFFLGNSLFSTDNYQTDFETTYWCETNMCSTENGVIRELTAEENEEMTDKIQRYIALSLDKTATSKEES